MPPSPSPVRLFTDAALIKGQDIALLPEQFHYLSKVMRRRPYDPVVLFNGRDGEWISHISHFGKKTVTVSVDHQTRPQRKSPDLWLLFAPVKRAAIDFITQKATELGVSVLCPVETGHTSAGRVNTERLTAIAVEAAEQSGRMTIPIVHESVPLADALADWHASRPLFVLDESGIGEPIAKSLKEYNAQNSVKGAFLIGPEGGFTNEELDLLRSLPFSKHVSLGPRILRTETAALAALTCWQALCGDWHDSAT